MEFSSVISGENIVKKYKGFELNIPKFEIPKGFATAFIGENGAGKTTFIDILAGIQLDYKGSLKYFEKYNADDREKNPVVKNRIGYTGTGNYYLPMWTLRQAKEIQELLFPDFNSEKYDEICKKLAIVHEDGSDMNKKVSELSDGNRTKLMLAGVLSRDTDLLLLDEPASPLDPLMRDKLCEMMRDYLNIEEGEKSIIFSTHNIADMEAVTDYAVIVENGTIVEAGFVEDLKEKYVLVHGEKKDAETAKNILYSISINNYGFEGVCLAENVDKLAGMDVELEAPSLSQICVAVMKNNSKLF